MEQFKNCLVGLQCANFSNLRPFSVLQPVALKPGGRSSGSKRRRRGYHYGTLPQHGLSPAAAGGRLQLSAAGGCPVCHTPGRSAPSTPGAGRGPALIQSACLNSGLSKVHQPWGWSRGPGTRVLCTQQCGDSRGMDGSGAAGTGVAVRGSLQGHAAMAAGASQPPCSRRLWWVLGYSCAHDSSTRVWRGVIDGRRRSLQGGLCQNPPGGGFRGSLWPSWELLSLPTPPEP